MFDVHSSFSILLLFCVNSIPFSLSLSLIYLLPRGEGESGLGFVGYVVGWQKGGFFFPIQQ